MYKVKQVAQRLNLSESKVYELVEAGRIPHYRHDGTIRISEEQIQEYLSRIEVRGRMPEPAQRQPGPRPLLKHLRLS